jgi:hypothetical protein
MKDHVRYFANIATTWAEQVRCGFLKQSDAWYALSKSVMKSIEYTFMATMMTKKEINFVMIPIMKIGLSKSGICRSFPRKVVHSMCDYQGLGLVDPYFTQGLRKIQLFLIPKKSLPLLTCVIDTSTVIAKMESGLGINLLCKPALRIKHITTRG